MVVSSDLDVDDPLDDERAGDDHDAPPATSRTRPERLVEQRLHVVGVDERDDDSSPTGSSETTQRTSAPGGQRARRCAAARRARGSSPPRGRSPRPCCRRSRAEAPRRARPARGRGSPSAATTASSASSSGTPSCSSATTRRNSLLRRLGRVLDGHRERAGEAVAGAHRGRDHLEVVASCSANSPRWRLDLARISDHAPRTAWRARAAPKTARCR